MPDRVQPTSYLTPAGFLSLSLSLPDIFPDSRAMGMGLGEASQPDGGDGERGREELVEGAAGTVGFRRCSAAKAGFAW